MDEFKRGKSLWYRVLLDDRVILTPDNRPLITPSRILSDAIAAEWERQIDLVSPSTMPLVIFFKTFWRFFFHFFQQSFWDSEILEFFFPILILFLPFGNCCGFFWNSIFLFFSISVDTV